MRVIRTLKRRELREAYTLIELLIVVGVLGLAASLLIPNMVGRDSMRAQAAARRVIADLSFAQSDALARQELRRVEFFDDGSGYGIFAVTNDDFDAEFDAETADWVRDPLSSPGSLGRMIVNFDSDTRFQGVRILDVALDNVNRYVVYDPLGGTIRTGGSPGIGGRIDLGMGEDRYRVLVSAFTGKLTVNRLDPE